MNTRNSLGGLSWITTDCDFSTATRQANVYITLGYLTYTIDQSAQIRLWSTQPGDNQNERAGLQNDRQGV